jgi:hypothetical protein
MDQRPAGDGPSRPPPDHPGATPSSFSVMPETLETRNGADSGGPPERWEPPTLWGLARAHKRVSGAVLAILVVLVVIVVVSDLTDRVTRITDSTPCSVWGSANQGERDAYAARYVKEHGPLPSGASDAPTIEGVIDDGCTYAYGFDEADTVSVLQSIRKQY